MANIRGTAGDDRLIGTAGNDVLEGFAGNDRLDGGAGNDLLIGGAGDDIYVIESTGDVVIENANEGIDEITIFNLLSYTLPSNIENLDYRGSGSFIGIGNEFNNIIAGFFGNQTLYGRDGDDSIFGSADDDRLFGENGNDYLSGGSGNDVLNGGPGNDQLFGGPGNDLYAVDSTGDVVTEFPTDGGIDTVNTSLSSYTLGGEIENLTFVGQGDFRGTGNSLDNSIRGGAGDDVLRGGAGDDYLFGQGGDDFLDGGTGNDVYGVDSVRDSVSEAANAGIDTVQTTLSSYALGNNVENLTFVGSGAFTGVGNSLNNIIRGGNGQNAFYAGDGNDILYGGSSADILRGGSGNDVLIGGGGADRFEFLFSAGRDRINDFGTDDTLVFQGNFSTAQQVLNNARQVGADTVITFDANNSITLSNFARTKLTAGDISIVPSGSAASVALAPDTELGFEKTLDFGSSVFDDGLGTDDAFSFDLDALIDSLVSRDTDALKSDSGFFAAAESAQDVSALFAQSPDAVSFDFVSASHAQLIDHGALFTIA